MRKILSSLLVIVAFSVLLYGQPSRPNKVDTTGLASLTGDNAFTGVNSFTQTILLGGVTNTVISGGSASEGSFTSTRVSGISSSAANASVVFSATSPEGTALMKIGSGVNWGDPFISFVMPNGSVGIGKFGAITATSFIGPSFGSGSGLTALRVPPVVLVINNPGAGSNAVVYIDNDMVINRVTLLADASGSASVDFRKCTYLQYDASATHPAAGDSITATHVLTVSSGTKAQATDGDGSILLWSQNISAGDVLQAYVSSASGIGKLTLCVSLSPR